MADVAAEAEPVQAAWDPDQVTQRAQSIQL